MQVHAGLHIDRAGQRCLPYWEVAAGRCLADSSITCCGLQLEHAREVSWGRPHPCFLRPDGDGSSAKVLLALLGLQAGDCCHQKYIPALQVLVVDLRGKVDVSDKLQWTPLHSVASYGHIATMQKLIGFGHAVDCTCKLGEQQHWDHAAQSVDVILG